MTKDKKVKFVCDDNSKDYAESMLFDSGCIAELEKNNVAVELRITGEKKLYYKDEIYKMAYDYPDELKKLFKTGEAYNSNDVEIIDNNWLCIVIYKDNEYEEDFVFEYDLSKLTKNKLKKIMLEYANYYLEQQ